MTKTMKRLLLYSAAIFIIAALIGCKRGSELYWMYTRERLATESFKENEEYYEEKGLNTNVLYTQFDKEGFTNGDLVCLVMENGAHYEYYISPDCSNLGGFGYYQTDWAYWEG